VRLLYGRPAVGMCVLDAHYVGEVAFSEAHGVHTRLRMTLLMTCSNCHATSDADAINTSHMHAGPM
jgi:hypothetical protein